LYNKDQVKKANGCNLSYNKVGNWELEIGSWELGFLNLGSTIWDLRFGIYDFEMMVQNLVFLINIKSHALSRGFD